MKKHKVFILLLLTSLLFTHSCTVLQQAQQAMNLINCEFRLKSADQIQVAGINVQNVKKLTDLSITDGAKLMAAVAGNTLPLTFTLNMEARNPNAAAAGLSSMDWIMLIDDIEMTRGKLARSFTIPAKGGTAVIPVQMNIDLKKVLKGKSAEAIANFGLNLAGQGAQPTRMALKIKPSINVGGSPLSFPDYITVRKDFVSK